MSIVALFVLGRKLRKSPRLVLALIAVGVFAADAIFLASVMIKDRVAEEEQQPMVAGMPEDQPGDEIYVNSLRPIDNQAEAQVEEALAQKVLRLAIARPVTVSDEDAP